MRLLLLRLPFQMKGPTISKCSKCPHESDTDFMGKPLCFECRNAFLDEHGALEKVMARARKNIVPHPRGNLKKLCDRSKDQHLRNKKRHG